MNYELEKVAEEIRLACSNADFKLVLMSNHEDNIIIRNGQIEKMLHASATSLAMNLLIDGRDGFFYTNNLAPAALKQFIHNAIETTRMLEPDEARTHEPTIVLVDAANHPTRILHGYHEPAPALN